MAAVHSIDFGWAEHPDAKYSNAGKIEAPLVSARLAAHESHVFFRADLNPSAAFTVFPLAAAYEVEGLIPHDLDDVYDPVLRLKLRIWKGRQRVQVLGDQLDKHLALRLPVAFDSAGTIGTAILGQGFFHAARVVLDRQQGNTASAS